MGNPETVTGSWRLLEVGGEIAPPVPLVRLTMSDTHASHGWIDVELAEDCSYDGPWRFGPSGLFLAGLGGGSGSGTGTTPDRFRHLVVFRRHPSWLHDAVHCARVGDDLVLRDRRGERTARLGRPDDVADDPPATDHHPRLAPLPATLAPPDRDQLLGTWRPAPAAPYRLGWQSVTFHDDATWSAAPRGIINHEWWASGPHSELVAIQPYAIALGYAPDGGVHDWLLRVARAGLTRGQPVVLDDQGGELVRLTRRPC